MADANGAMSPGGFLPNSLPSPAPSALSTRSTAGLPHPRGQALRAGSSKEDMVRRFIESRLMDINRRYVKKFGLQEPGDDVVGYKSMSELCRDVDAVVNTLWLSGTPSLQIPYLLNIAGELTTWMSSFPPSPIVMFSLLHKLDHCFASLISGHDLDTKETLPGFENGLRGGMSRTDMVRCKSIVFQTRVLIVHIMSLEPENEEEDVAEASAEDQAEENDAPSASNAGNAGLEDDEEQLHMDVARVYENTISLLGDTLDDVVDRTTSID